MNSVFVKRIFFFSLPGQLNKMKHILETKHEENNFRCAVIVNDMAALNIDKSLIDQSALVQGDEVIAMQNGCFCCTLQNDLVEAQGHFGTLTHPTNPKFHFGPDIARN